ncbi:MAG: serine hydrolase, partial [Desertifilum sp. SIO1I2]|nr:serine hydrolase [Desertifilum sp. SIO1I2]
NKTGTLGVLLADMGLVDTPTGKHYAIAVMVKREFGDPAAEELIYQVSRAAYQHFSVPTATPTPILEQAPLPSPNRPEGLPVEPAEATANRR